MEIAFPPCSLQRPHLVVFQPATDERLQLLAADFLACPFGLVRAQARLEACLHADAEGAVKLDGFGVGAESGGGDAGWVR